MRSVLRNPDHQAHFDRYGWVKVPFLSPDDIRALEQGFRAVAARFGQGWQSTFLMDNHEVRTQSAAVIKEVFAPRIRELLDNYITISHNYITKGRSEESVVDFHTHPSFVDESTGLVTPNVFCTLVDTNDENGNLQVVSGTHRLPRFPRQVLPQSDPFKGYCELFRERAESVPTSAGDAIVFDNLLIHGSPPNRTPEMRVVASALAVPVEAEPVLYFEDVPGRLKMCRIDEDYFARGPLQSWKPENLIREFEKPFVGDLGQQVRDALGM